MLLEVEGPAGMTLVGLAEQESSMGVETTIDTLDAERTSGFPGEPWLITVYGADKPGIVAAVAEALARKGVNVDDLTTRRLAGDSGATYTMLIDATVPPGVSDGDLVSDLETLAVGLGITCHARPADSDTL